MIPPPEAVLSEHTIEEKDSLMNVPQGICDVRVSRIHCSLTAGQSLNCSYKHPRKALPEGGNLNTTFFKQKPL